MFSFVCFFLHRILSRIQAGAGNVWSYWQTHSSPIRGLVWMRRPHSGKVVTLHFVTMDKSFVVQLQTSTATSSVLTNRLLPAAAKTTNTTTISFQPHRKKNIILSKWLTVYLCRALLYRAVCILGGKKKHVCSAFTCTWKKGRKCPYHFSSYTLSQCYLSHPLAVMHTLMTLDQSTNCKTNCKNEHSSCV